MQVRNGLGWTFNTDAENYEKMRPGYAAALYEDIFDAVPLNGTSRAVEVVAREEKELQDAIQKLYTVYKPGSRPSKEFVEEDAKMWAAIAEKYGFVDISYHLYHRKRTFTAKEYLALLGTYSDHIAMEESIRKEFFGEIEKTIEKFGGTISIYDTMDLELARRA